MEVKTHSNLSSGHAPSNPADSLEKRTVNTRLFQDKSIAVLRLRDRRPYTKADSTKGRSDIERKINQRGRGARGKCPVLGGLMTVICGLTGRIFVGIEWGRWRQCRARLAGEREVGITTVGWHTRPDVSE